MGVRKAKVMVDGIEKEVEIDFPDAAPTSAPRIRKTVLVARIVAVAGLAAKVMTALNANAAQRLTFDAATDFATDDPQLRALLTAAGADLGIVLAP